MQNGVGRVEKSHAIKRKFSFEADCSCNFYEINVYFNYSADTYVDLLQQLMY